MSTHATIALHRPVSDTYDAVYCHFDGYPDFTLMMLQTCYDTYDKVSNLLSFGNLSSIGPNTEICQFYIRDRDEESTDNKAIVVNTVEDLMRHGEEYVYLFKKNKWKHLPHDK